MEYLKVEIRPIYNSKYSELYMEIKYRGEKYFFNGEFKNNDFTSRWDYIFESAKYQLGRLIEEKSPETEGFRIKL